MRCVLLAFLAFVLTTTAFAQSGARLLSGRRIQQDLIGNTMSGISKGETYSEYLNPNGTIAGHSASGDYAGRWRIAGNEICLAYEDSQNGKWDCTGVRLRGDEVIWDDKTTSTLSSGPTPSAVPTTGNPPAFFGASGNGVVAVPYPPPYVAMVRACIQPRGLFVWPGSAPCCCF